MGEKKSLLAWLEEKTIRKIIFFVISMALLFGVYFIAKAFLV